MKPLLLTRREIMAKSVRVVIGGVATRAYMPERMTKDLDVPVEVIPIPTVREADGLAMSSRNTYLNQQERQAALVLSGALSYANGLMKSGPISGEDIRAAVEEFIRREPLAEIDYVAVADPETMENVSDIGDTVLVALAVKIGRTRLIDNEALINPHSPGKK